MSNNDSKINALAAARMSGSKINGAVLLEMFKSLETQMGLLGAEGHFTQFQFIESPDELEEGDLIPEIHLSLRPYYPPIMSEPAELNEEG